MILQEIGRRVNALAGNIGSKLSLDQIDTFLQVLSEDIDLAEHVLELIQKSHGIGLEIPAQPDNTPTAQSE